MITTGTEAGFCNTGVDRTFNTLGGKNERPATREISWQMK